MLPGPCRPHSGLMSSSPTSMHDCACVEEWGSQAITWGGGDSHRAEVRVRIGLSLFTPLHRCRGPNPASPRWRDLSAWDHSRDQEKARVVLSISHGPSAPLRQDGVRGWHLWYLQIPCAPGGCSLGWLIWAGYSMLPPRPQNSCGQKLAGDAGTALLLQQQPLPWASHHMENCPDPAVTSLSWSRHTALREPGPSWQPLR